MNARRVAESLRVIAREAGNIADELSPAPEREYLDPAIEGEELRRALEQLNQIEVEGLLSRALNRFTKPRTPSA
jgi:hypothetical protein